MAVPVLIITLLQVTTVAVSSVMFMCYHYNLFLDNLTCFAYTLHTTYFTRKCTTLWEQSASSHYMLHAHE